MNAHPPDTTPHAGPQQSRRSGPQRLQAGDRLSQRYRIEALVGRGGMAEIYAAHHEHLNKRVAIKVLQETHEKNDVILRGLKREAVLLASMPRHEHLVQVMDSAVDEARNLFFVVLELLEGKTLREYMLMRLDREAPFSIREAVTIAITLASTLYDLHAAHYYHRDLKPENVFIQKRVGDKPAVLKLLDLGAALAPSNEDFRTQEETRCIGTPEYMSPEQITKGAITARSDLYALGLILYELLRGAGAWRDRSFAPGQYVMSIAACQIHENPTPLVECVSGMPQELSDVVTKMIAKDPNARYQSGKEVAEALTAFLKKNKSLVREMRATGKELFVEAIVSAPRSAIPSSPRALPPPPPDTEPAPVAHRGPGQSAPPGAAFDATVPAHRPLRAPMFAPEVQTSPMPATVPHAKTANSNEGILVQAGLAAPGRASQPERVRGTMRMEIGKSGPVIAAHISGGLRIEKLSSPDEPPDADGVQSATLRELLPRLAPRDAVLNVDSLIVMEGPARLRGLRYPIEFVALKIGRAREANVVIPHVTVSRTHCGLFAVVDGVFEVVDTGSSYGIEVNDIATQRATLRARSRLRVGDVVLQLVRAGTKPPEAREARVYNSIAMDPSITAYTTDAVNTTGGFSRATVASSRDRSRFERAATNLPPAPGNESISVLALGKPTISSLQLDASLALRPAITPTEKMDANAKFRPGPSTLLRGGPNPWRQSEAKLTNDYFDADTFPPALKVELAKGNKATVEHLTASQTELGTAGMTQRLADCLFMINEHTARLELLAGAPPGKVYQERLAQARDWDAAAKTIVERVVALKARDRQSKVVLWTVGLLLFVGVGVLVYFLVGRSK